MTAGAHLQLAPSPKIAARQRHVRAPARKRRRSLLADSGGRTGHDDVQARDRPAHSIQVRWQVPHAEFLRRQCDEGRNKCIWQALCGCGMRDTASRIMDGTQRRLEGDGAIGQCSYATTYADDMAQ